MSVNSVSSASDRNPATPAVTPEDRVIQLLQKQKGQLQEKIKLVSEGKQDPKTKQEKIQEINTQIQQIDSQIQQKQMEKLKPDPAKISAPKDQNESEKQSEDENNAGNNAATSQYMISAAVGYSDMKTIGSIRNKFVNEARIASHSGENPEAASGINSKIDKLEDDILTKSQEIDKNLKKAAKDGSSGVDKPKSGEENEETSPLESTETDKSETKPSDIVNSGNADAANNTDSVDKPSSRHKNDQPLQGRHIDVFI